MTFGQANGPPASHRQISDLLTLLNEAGHTDFRDARGPMGFTQRQAGGKFTRDEADAYIQMLMDVTSDEPPTDDAHAPTPKQPRRGPVTASERKAATAKAQITKMPSDLLAAELQRRGWAVIEP